MRIMESIIYILILLFGLAIGSFMNAWVWRTRENLGIAKARSICPNCRIQIAWYDNIPLFSFIYLRGSCRKCEAKISYQYPIVEACLGLLFLFTALWHNAGAVVPQITPEIVRDWIILTFLVFVFLYDLKYGEILNFTTIWPGLILFFTAMVFGWQSLDSMFFGALFGAGFFLFLYAVSKGRWIGGGDVRLGFFMGIILGWPNVLVAFFVAYMTGAVISLLLIALKKKTLKSRTAFGTYLVFGTIVAMFFCNNIITWYLSLIA